MNMQKFLIAMVITTAWHMPAMAADVMTTSKVDHVTVFPQGADVTRVADVTLVAGEHRILIKDLPAGVDPRSIRVKGSDLAGVAIASVDTRLQGVDPALTSDQAKRIQDEITALSIARADLDQTVADSNHQRQFLLNLADKQMTPQSSTETVKGIDVAQLTGLLDLVGQRLEKLAVKIQEAQAKQREIDLKIQTLNVQLASLAPITNQLLEATISVDVAGPVSGTLEVSYRLNEAGWMPYYDADLKILPNQFAGKMDLVRRAEVTQWSGERWDDISLTLSTTRPSGTTAAPYLSEEEIHQLADPRKVDSQKIQNLAPAAPQIEELSMADTAFAEQDGKKAKETKVEVVQQRQAVMEIAGFQANYVIAGRLSVDNAGTAKKVRIASATQDTNLSIEAVPMLDQTAYLTAEFKLAGDGPLLPGYVNLYRAGVYLGQGNLPLLNPGENAELGFGADDLVKIERKEVKKLVGEQGMLTTSNIEERSWDISIKNLHDMPIKVTVLDRMPFAANKEIEIERLDGMTVPTRIDDEKRRGVMAYDVEVAPRADAMIKTGYSITWPESMRIGATE